MRAHLRRWRLEELGVEGSAARRAARPSEIRAAAGTTAGLRGSVRLRNRRRRDDRVRWRLRRSATVGHVRLPISSAADRWTPAAGKFSGGSGARCFRLRRIGVELELLGEKLREPTR